MEAIFPDTKISLDCVNTKATQMFLCFSYFFQKMTNMWAWVIGHFNIGLILLFVISHWYKNQRAINAVNF